MIVRDALRLALGASVALAAISLGGCGGPTAEPKTPAVVEASDEAVEVDDAPAEEEVAEPVETTAEDPAASLEIKQIVDGDGYDLSFGQEFPRLKAGTARATISAPKNWKAPGRLPEYVVWFVEKIGAEFPRVLVTSEPAPADTPDTTAENVVALARQIGATVDADAKTLETAKPMIVGGIPCVRYVSSAKSRRGVVEEQILKTVQGGQLFAVTLQAEVDPAKPDEGLIKYRDAGYAVMASLNVEAPAATDAAPPVETPPPGETAVPPGETPTADAAPLEPGS